MVRYSKIILSIANVGIPIFSYYTLLETKDAFNQCENLWAYALGSSFLTLLLLLDSVGKVCNEKKIIWTSYCCIPIPYTVIVYVGSIILGISQLCKFISLNHFCNQYYKLNYYDLWLLIILQLSNYALNILLFF